MYNDKREERQALIIKSVFGSQAWYNHVAEGNVPRSYPRGQSLCPEIDSQISAILEIKEVADSLRLGSITSLSPPQALSGPNTA